jgi:glycosyltransferase involved in cell wall biosynthesis
MQNLDRFLQHLNGLGQSPKSRTESLPVNLLLAALILGVRPGTVLELGMGTADLSVGMLHTLNFAGVGCLTIVEDWSAWNGREPEGVGDLRAAGVAIEAPVKPADFIRKAHPAGFDLVVCRADLADDPERLSCLLRLCAQRGRLLVHGINRSRRFRLAQRMQESGGARVLLLGGDTEVQDGILLATSEANIATAMAGRPGAAQRETLFLGLVKGDGYGWGVCSRYLIAELSRIRPIHVLTERDGTASEAHLNGPLFQAIADIDFHPVFPQARGRRNVGYTFFENELSAVSLENAKRFDLILGGSNWCRERMIEKGVTNCGVLVQGIDPELFYPIEECKSAERFVIFSGGKFELRKGQDLVLRAVKIMQDKYPDVWLVNCWYNLWPASTRLMTYSKHIRFEHREQETWQVTMQRTYLQNGLDPTRIQTFELLPQERQRDLFAQTDIGLFPNRCEGGTNLVLMEYMACAKPVIASNASGHRDIVHSDNSLLLNDLTDYLVRDRDGRLIARWQEPSLDEMVAQLEYAYHHRSNIRNVGQCGGEHMKKFTWRHAALNLIRLMEN